MSHAAPFRQGGDPAADGLLSNQAGAERAWSGVEDAQLRRKLQNRMNQRLSRKRKAAQRDADAQMLAARLANPVARPILPKPQPASATPMTEEGEPARLVQGEAPSMMHDARRDQRHTLSESLATIPRVISPFFAAHPDLTDAHFLRIFQFTITSLLPTIGIHTAAGEPLPTALCRTALSDPLVFHAVLAGGSSQLTFRTHSSHDQRVLLKAETHIARAVREHLASGTAHIPDTVLFAIMSIALKQDAYILSLTPAERYAGAFESPVKALGGLYWLGMIHMVPEHTGMWVYLLNARDEALSVKVPGLLDYLQTTDLLRASALLERPKMEMGEGFCSLLDGEAASIRPDVSQVEAFRVGEGFEEVLLDMRMCCRLIETFHGRVPLDSRTSKFVQYRNLVQYRLLSLPPGQDEICRLAALVFAYGVLYPFPDPRPLRKLTQDLAKALSDPAQTADESAEFLLWAAVIGGIAAAGSANHDTFALEVSRHVQLLGLRDWTSVMAVLQKFIWLERACGAGGRALFARASGDVAPDPAWQLPLHVRTTA